MAASVSVKADVRELTKRLRFMQRKQIPFALSQALNDTAFQARKEIVTRTYPDAFTVRNQRFAGVAFRVQKSTKRDPKAAVYDRLDRAFLPYHIVGAQKTPYTGSSLAVPTRAIKRLKSGKISARQRPSRATNTFRGNPFGKGQGIWQRQRDGSVKLLYNLEPSVRIDRVFRMGEAVEQVVRKQFRRNFSRRLARALATAR